MDDFVKKINSILLQNKKRTIEKNIRKHRLDRLNLLNDSIKKYINGVCNGQKKKKDIEKLKTEKFSSL